MLCLRKIVQTIIVAVMTDEKNLKEVNDVLRVLDELIPLVEKMEHNFRSARNWGFIDIAGGGFLTNLIKHAKLSSAADVSYRVNELLEQLRRELNDVVMPADFTMNDATFATFADFVFDGLLTDVYMQSKIMTSLNQVKELHRRLLVIRSEMNRLKS